MIVMKFGGTSVADAERIRIVTEIVRARRDAAPVVVVSALAQVTDLLAQAADAAAAGEREAIEPILAEIGRRHRWALDAVAPGSRRHDLGLEIDAVLEDLRQLLRSVRLIGERTPRSADALLAFGEHLASQIVAAALVSAGLPARWLDAREVLVTDASHGRAEPDLERTAARSRERIEPAVAAGDIPVLGGFVGATPDGRTTTLGRGGSDTSASVLGAVLEAREIQIWTDVDGILSADPKLVPSATTLRQVSFAEAAELAFYGAKVLHPASIAPAVRRRIPVRVLNTLRPEGAGTVIVEVSGPDAPPVACVASRSGIAALRFASRTMRVDPGFLPAVLAALDALGGVPDLVVASEVGITVAVSGALDAEALHRSLADRATVDVRPGLAVVCVVGSGLERDPAVRDHVLSALASCRPEAAALGGSATSAAALVPADRLADVVRALHARFFGEGGS